MRGLLRQKATSVQSPGGNDTEWALELSRLCDSFKDLCATSYDILAEIWTIDPSRRFEHGLNSLDAISRVNRLGGKLSHGAEAPRRWANTEYAHVLNYCQDDVLKTKALFEQIMETGTILRGDGRPIVLPRHTIGATQ
jgi:hypothetical protein